MPIHADGILPMVLDRDGDAGRSESWNEVLDRTEGRSFENVKFDSSD